MNFLSVAITLMIKFRDNDMKLNLIEMKLNLIGMVKIIKGYQFVCFLLSLRGWPFNTIYPINLLGTILSLATLLLIPRC